MEDLIAYYTYLIQISGPALGGLFLVYLLLGYKLYVELQSLRTNRSVGILFKITARTALALLIGFIYGNMFLTGYEDWGHLPVIIQGEVALIEPEAKGDQEQAALTVKSGEEKTTVAISPYLQSQLQVGDIVEIAYLSQKNEVFRCVRLSR